VLQRFSRRAARDKTAKAGVLLGIERIAADDAGVHLSPARIGTDRPREQQLRVDRRIRHARAGQHVGRAS
jgi:hypothetical protein